MSLLAHINEYYPGTFTGNARNTGTRVVINAADDRHHSFTGNRSGLPVAPRGEMSNRAKNSVQVFSSEHLKLSSLRNMETLEELRQRVQREKALMSQSCS